jgi:IS5 family transposase
MPMTSMIRIHFMQQWFGYSDPAMEEALYDIPVLRAFAGLDAFEDHLPDETTILRFRHLLEKHYLADAIFDEVQAVLVENNLLLKQGSVVDATLIDAPSSTKNKAKKRDPEMSQTKKGNQWYFGMKAHIGADVQSGLVHTVTGTTAKDSDHSQLAACLHGEEQFALADRGYHKNSRTWKELEVEDGVAIITPYKKPAHRHLNNSEKRTNKWLAKHRAKVEHPFRVIKRQFGFTKVRYRGLTKNTAQLKTLFALCNVWMVRHELGT